MSVLSTVTDCWSQLPPSTVNANMRSTTAAVDLEAPFCIRKPSISRGPLQPQRGPSPPPNYELLTEKVFLDCEMLLTAATFNSKHKQVLARASLINDKGELIYDICVEHQMGNIIPSGLKWAGLTRNHIQPAFGALPFSKVKENLRGLLRDRILVGHALHNDTRALEINQSWELRGKRDTQTYSGFRRYGRITPGLAFLSELLLDQTIQSSFHCSIEDAKATRQLYKLQEMDIDAEQGFGDKSVAPLPVSITTEENADDTNLIDLSAALGWLSFETVTVPKEGL